MVASARNVITVHVYVHAVYVVFSGNTRLERMIADVMRNVLEVKMDGKNMRKDIRHLHHLVLKGKKGDNTEIENDVRTDMLTDYIPCASFKELQNLDDKFRVDEGFFNDAVSHCLPFKSYTQVNTGN